MKSTILKIISLALLTNSVLASQAVIDVLDIKDKKRNEKWLMEMSSLDLSSDQNVFELGGVTSCNVHVSLIDPSKDDGFDKIGKFIPENMAGNPNTEVAYFNLARILGVTKFVQKAVHYELDQKGARKFVKAVKSADIKSKSKKTNCDYLVKKVRSEKMLKGAYKDKEKGDTRDLYDYYTGKGIKLTKHLPSLLKQGNPMPSEKLVTIESEAVPSDYLNEEHKLVRQLFHIYIFDVLFGQFDRYSGLNFTARLDEGEKEVNFYAKDNGGTYLIKGYGTKYQRPITEDWFSRYDQETMVTLGLLQKFLNGDIPEFFGMKSKEEFASKIGLKLTKTNNTGAGSISINHQLSVLTGNLNLIMEKFNKDVIKAKSNGDVADAFLPNF